MTTYKIKIAYPPKELSPNARVHWAKKAKAASLQRSATRAILAGEMNGARPLWDGANVEIVAHPADRRRRDRDNLLAALKSAFDGAEDAGLVKDDAGFTYQPIQWGEPENPPCVVITFSEIA